MLKIEASCTKFDHRGKGYLSVDEIFNVVKLQNGINVSKDEVSIRIFVKCYTNILKYTVNMTYVLKYIKTLDVLICMPNISK